MKRSAWLHGLRASLGFSSQRQFRRRRIAAGRAAKFEALEDRRLLAIDYGDAPDTGLGSSLGNYQTLSTDNGASHTIVVGLKLGANVDGDGGALQNIVANADDVNGALPDDEDGVTNPASDLVLTIGAQPTIDVRVTNTTGTSTALYGWIDYNADGVFDNTTERTWTLVPNGSNNAIKTLVFPTVPAGFTGTTYARFRLSTDVAGANSTGPAADGEVEDYRVSITAQSEGTANSAKTTKIASETGGGPTLANSDYFGRSVAAIGDIDGDGVTDLAVGANGDDTGGSGRGAVHILFMNPDGTVRNTQKLTSLFPTSNGDYFGSSIASLGDLNGDGVPDIAVGAERSDFAYPQGSYSNVGITIVVFLNSNGTQQSSELIYHGNLTGGTTLHDNDYFGHSQISPGDLDGDGVTDLIVGAHGDDTGGANRGAVHVLFMNSNGTVKSRQKIASGNAGGPTLANSDYFGSSIASLGDLDGDGITDIAVGAVGDDTGGSGRGAVHILFMNSDGTVKTRQKIASGLNGGPALANNDQFGRSLAAMGDLDGDGVTELAVGAYYDDTGGTNRGAVHVLYLNADGTVKATKKIASGTGGGPALANDDRFGVSLSSLGDLDGDGIIDLAVGANFDDTGGTNRGAVYVLFSQHVNTNPVFTSPNSASVVENSTAVLNVTATDYDIPAQTISYSIVGGPDQTWFSITSGGALSFTTAPDYEAPLDSNIDNIYTVVVQASDGSGGTTSQSINVTVTPTNDNSPIFTTPATVNVPENNMAVTFDNGSLSGPQVGRNFAGPWTMYDDFEFTEQKHIVGFRWIQHDADAVEREYLGTQLKLYKSTPSIDNLVFSDTVIARRTITETIIQSEPLIEYEFTGLSLNLSPDTYYLALHDPNSGYSGWVQTTGTVQTIPGRWQSNEPHGLGNFYGNENSVFQVITSDVITVSAMDADVPTQSLTYSLLELGDYSAFSITSGGVLSFNAPPDYEAPNDTNGDNVYVVTVQASDGAGGTTTQTISLTVTAVNDNDPQFVSPDTASVAGNTTGVMTVAATDADLPAQSITYAIVGGADQSKFTLAGDGALSFVSPPNYYVPGDADGDNIYVVTVEANDGGGGTTSQTIHVTVTPPLRDYGDAPDTGVGTAPGDYQTLAANSGASHEIVNGLKMGANIDGDDGTRQNAAANADDLINLMVGPPLQSTQLIASSTFEGSIYHIDSAGELTLIASGLAQPHGVAVDAAGNVYVAEVGADVVRRIRADGLGTDVIYSFDSGLDNPEGIAIGADGRLYVAGTIDGPHVGDPNALYQITPSGVGNQFASVGPLENLGVVFDRAGNIFVTDLAQNGSIWRVTPNQESALVVSDLGRALGIAVSADGESLLVADDIGDRILKVSPTGDVSVFAEIAAPFALAVDSMGNVFVGQSGPDQVTRIAPDGTQSVFATGISNVRGLAIFNSGAASSANNALSDDEDGLSDPAADLVLTIGAQPTVNVRVTNTTGSAGTLYGWIDYNADGVFDNATERASVSVPSGSSNVVATLNFPSVPVGFTGQTYARFRLSTDAAASNPTGNASDGEVEDYRATITSPSSGTVDSAKSKKIAHDKGGGPSLSNGDTFGSAVAAIGDLDGDGVTDVAVGAQIDNSGTGTGAMYVLLMNSDGTVKTRQKITSGVGGLALSNGDYFGRSIAALGDLDGDGVTDLAVGADKDDTGGSNRGAVHVLFMNSDGTVKSSQKIAHNTNGGPSLANVDRFGATVTSLGDLDGDGVADLAVGASGDDSGGNYRGAVHVLLMKTDGTVKSSQKIAHSTGGGPLLTDGDQFGSAVASVGDLDGDGLTDLAVGAFGDDTGGNGRGAVHMLFLNANGTAKSSQKIAHNFGGGPALANSDYFGSSVAALGDLNGDGVTDLGIGSRYDDTGGAERGAIYVAYLNANGTVKESQKVASGVGGGPTLANGDIFGRALASLGDLDGDGITDIAVTAERDDTGGANRGAVHVLFLKKFNNVPVITSADTATVAENAASVMTVTATDADVPAQALTFSIVGGADQSKFAITGDGALSFVTAPDFDLPGDADGDNVYSVTVQADDGNGGTATQTISVTVTPINDNTPEITSADAVNVAENSTNVLTVTAADADLPAQSLTYSIVGGTDQAKFTITGSGELSFVSAPDFESPTDANGDNVYVVIVQASDGTFTDLQAILVSVAPVNDHNPVITSSSTVSIAENTSAVLTVTSTDADLPAQSLSYSIVGGDDQAKFVITADGALSFNTPPDYELPSDANGDNLYVVTVQVSDGSGGTATQTIHVTVTPVNDGAPAFTSPATVNVGENTTAVLTVTATDGDVPAQSVTFSLVGGADQSKFAITEDGTLSFVAAPDFEVPADADGDNTFVVTLQASDGSLTSNQTIQVAVTPVNDNAPAITSPDNLSIPENSTEVLTLTATDADLPAQSISYSLVGGADLSKFSITSGGALAFLTAPDFEAPADSNSDNVYVVIVQASDGEFTNIKAMLVTVTNVNEVFAGDYNRDGSVDAADYTRWRDTQGMAVEPFDGADGDGNGLVDSGDYTVWQMNFGNTLPPGQGSVALTINAQSAEAIGTEVALNEAVLNKPAEFATRSLAEPSAAVLQRRDTHGGSALQVGSQFRGERRDRLEAIATHDRALLAWLSSRRQVERQELPARDFGDWHSDTAELDLPRQFIDSLDVAFASMGR